MALSSRLQTYQTLTNDDQMLTFCLSDKDFIQLRMSKTFSMLFFRNVLGLFLQKSLTFHFCSQILFSNLICWNKLLKLSAVMAYTNSKPVARKSFSFLCVLLLSWLINEKLFLVTGFEFVYLHHNCTLPT